MTLVSYFNLFSAITSLSSRFFFLYSLSVFVPEKARLEELKGKLAPLKSSSMQMYPIDFEKVRKEHSDTSVAHTAEATDRVAAEP